MLLRRDLIPLTQSNSPTATGLQWITSTYPKHTPRTTSIGTTYRQGITTDVEGSRIGAVQKLLDMILVYPN